MKADEPSPYQVEKWDLPFVRAQEGIPEMVTLVKDLPFNVNNWILSSNILLSREIVIIDLRERVSVLEGIVKQPIITEWKSGINNISRSNIINMIVIPMALALSFISLISAFIFLSMGAWITSIPFILSTIFGVYYFSLQGRKSK